MPRVLVLGGLDPVGGAGITADARALLAVGCHAMTVATTLTIQNRRGLRDVQDVPVAHWQAAMVAVLEDGPVHAIKTGLLGSAAQVRALAAVLRTLELGVPLVVDPVMAATAGGWRAAGDLAVALREDLLPMADLAMPNLPELARLGAADPSELLQQGTRAVLLKGGHGEGPELEDVLHTTQAVRRWSHPRLEVGPVHGTGCALASFTTGRLAQGHHVGDAVDGGIRLLQHCLRHMGQPAADGLSRPLALRVS